MSHQDLSRQEALILRGANAVIAAVTVVAFVVAMLAGFDEIVDWLDLTPQKAAFLGAIGTWVAGVAGYAWAFATARSPD